MEDEFIRGRGYLWQGQWLGFDRSAMGIVKIRKSDIVGEEETNEPGHPNHFWRIVTSVGAVWIVFDLDSPRIPGFTFTSHQPNPRIQQPPALPPTQPKRIFYLPASLPRYDEEKKDE